MAELSRRNAPTQARARATVERVLEAAARLLEREGLDAFNTNAIAKEADVRVSTVYRYFPNKQAILAEFAHRFASAEEAWLADFSELAEADWRAGLTNLLSRYIERADAFPAIVALRQATRADPALQTIERASADRLAKALSASLRARRPGLAAPRSRAMATLVIDIASQLVDQSRTLPSARRRAMRTELLQLLERYLAPELD